MTWTKPYYQSLWQRVKRRVDRFVEISRAIQPRIGFPDPSYLQIGEARSIIATILFVDIVSFTERSMRVSSRELLFTLDLFLSEMTQVVKDWGGTIEKYTGDGLMAIFDTSNTDIAGMVKKTVDAATTMRCIIEGPINAHLKEKGIEEISYRIGIDGGQVLVGNIGIQSNKEPVTIGWPANIASKLQEIAPVNGILISGFVHSSLPAWEQNLCYPQPYPADWIYVKRDTSDRYPIYLYRAYWIIQE